jgi:hypothetical protein
VISFRQLIFLSLFVSIPVFSQSVGDTSKASNKENRNKQNYNLPKIPDKSPSPFEFHTENIFIPLNLKIYGKAMVNEYKKPRKFTAEELSTGMSDDELTSFDSNKLNTKKMLSDLYGEDLIDEEKILESLGITKEQIIGIVAILRFFLQHY